MLVERGTILTRINWTGVIAGLAVGAVTQLALSALGVTFGSAYADTAGGLAIGTVIWLAVSLAISAFLAGLVAARAAGYLTPAQGRFNGLVTGALLSLLTTLLLSNALTAGFRAASGVVSGVASAASSAASAAGSAAANSGVGQTDAVQSLVSGLSPEAIGQLIGQSAPDLSTQQATAASQVVSGIVQRASTDLGKNVGNVSNLSDFVTNRVNSISSALQGPDFINRLQKQGLSKAQAQATATAISSRVTEIKQQASDAAAATERIARHTANTAAWGFLLALGVILGCSTLGGGRGSDVPKDGLIIDENTRGERTSGNSRL